MRTPLAIGTDIVLSEIGTTHQRIFHLIDVVGMGASCIVYTASYRDAEGNLFTVRLKEFYPLYPIISREGNCLCIDDEHATEFNEMLSCFTSGYQKQLEFLRDAAQTNSISGIQGIYTGNHTKYIAMRCNSGACLTDRQELAFVDILRIVRAVAIQMQHFHDNGYLYLDLKPGNIFLYPETLEMVMLFDFDSVIRKQDVRQHTEWLSYTEDWAAPELCRKQAGKIDERADVYAVGALLLFLLFKRKPKPSDRRRFVDWSEEIAHSILALESPENYRLVTELLQKTLTTNVDSRYPDCGALLDVIEPYLDSLLAPKPCLKTYLPLGTNFFCGRSAEIGEIHDLLKQNRFVFLHGIGGIGKSELAKHYAMQYVSEYDAVLFVRFHKNMMQTITSDTNFPVANCKCSDGEEAAAYFERKLKILQEICTERHLIILDNFDTEDCDDLEALTGLRCEILVTSRVDYSEVFCQYDVDVLHDPEDLFRLMTYYYKADIDDRNGAALAEIIDAVQGHTMALELIAKHMQSMAVEPTIMLQKLHENGIVSGDHGKVRNVKDGTLKSQAAYAHIAALFSIFGLSENVKQVLRYAALFGPNLIDRDFFMESCDLTLAQQQALSSVIQCGWMQAVELPDSHALTLHPLISDVLCEELKPDIVHCEGFILFAGAFVEKLQSCNWEQRDLHIAWLDHTARNIHGNSTKITFLLDNLNMVYMTEEDYDSAVWCNLKIVDMIYALHEEEHFPRQILNSYLFLKTLARLTGHPEQEEVYIRKIRELGLEEGLEELASERCLDEMENEDHAAAKRSAEERVHYALHSEDPWRIAKAYRQLGQTEQALGNASEARSNFEHAAKLMEGYLRHHPEELDDDLAKLYSDAADMQCDAGNYETALQHYTKQKELLSAEFGEISGAVQDVYLSMALAYYEAGDREHQTECLEKHLEISEQVYGKLHQETALSYELLYKQYLAAWQESLDTALLESCAELVRNLICAQEFLNGEDSPEAAEWTMEYSDLLRLMGQEEPCYLNMKKAFRLYEDLLDADDMKWVDLCCRASDSFLFFGESDQSLQYLEQAIRICDVNGDEETLEQLSDYREVIFGS